MLEMLFLGYLTVVVGLFLGGAMLPRWRWPLLVLGTLGLLAPIALVVTLLIFLQSADIHLG